MKVYYELTVLTGGGDDALDSIDGNELNDGDKAFVYVTGNILYIYLLDADSGEAEASPEIISPDNNPGSKRWILQSTYLSSLHLLSAGIIYFGDSDTDGTWKIMRDGNDLKFYRRESGSYVYKGGFIA